MRGVNIARIKCSECAAAGVRPLIWRGVISTEAHEENTQRSVWSTQAELIGCQLLNKGENCHLQAPERSVFTSTPVKCKFQLRCGSIYVRLVVTRQITWSTISSGRHFTRPHSPALSTASDSVVFPAIQWRKQQSFDLELFSCRGHSDPWARESPVVSLFNQVIPLFFYICCSQMGFYCTWTSTVRGPVLLSSCII